MQSETLKAAYRATFQDYSQKLDALQQLMSAVISDKARIDAATTALEKARIAHNSARDQLAREFVPFPLTGADENRIRTTARLLWEMAGRPEGTAERDWQKAEQLVRTAASS